MAVKAKVETPAQIEARFRAMRVKIEATRKAIAANNKAYASTVAAAEKKYSEKIETAMRDLAVMSRELEPKSARKLPRAERVAAAHKELVAPVKNGKAMDAEVKKAGISPVLTKRDLEADYDFKNGPGSEKPGKKAKRAIG